MKRYQEYSSLFNLIISLSFSFQEYLACSQGVVNRWSSRKCRCHIIDLSAVWTHNIMVKGHCWRQIWHFLLAINTKLVDKPNCQDMWVRDSSVHKGLPGPDGYPSGPGALSWLSGDQLYSRLEDKMKLLELNDNWWNLYIFQVGSPLCEKDASPVLQDKGTALQISVILVLFLAFIWWMEGNVRPYLKFVIFMQTNWRFQSLVFMIMQRMDVFYDMQI